MRVLSWIGRRVRTRGAATALLVIAGMASASAVTTMSTGVKFLAGGKAFQTGYLTGSVDLLATLQDAGFLSPDRVEEAKRLVKCANNNKVEDFRQAMMQYYEKSPVHTNYNAASTFYIVLRGACR